MLSEVVFTTVNLGDVLILIILVVLLILILRKL